VQKTSASKSIINLLQQQLGRSYVCTS